MSFADVANLSVLRITGGGVFRFDWRVNYYQIPFIQRVLSHRIKLQSLEPVIQFCRQFAVKKSLVIGRRPGGGNF